jgi:hypothetical protein
LIPTPVFVDANIPMYAGGAEHRLKARCVRVLQLTKESPDRFATSAEVLQEIIHRYTAIRRWKQGRELFADFASVLFERVHPIYIVDVLRAAELADTLTNLSARDLLHLAVMHRLGIAQIVSTDEKFDDISGIERLDPMLVDEWAHLVTNAS